MVPTAFKIRHANKTDVGIRRSHNQDACAARPAADESIWLQLGHVFIVADGMGGHAVGEKASAKAISDIPLTYFKHIASEGIPAAIERAFVETNAGINLIGQINPEFKGLGTTGTALFLCADGAWVGHVGDSRVYRIRGSKIQQLTFDHSWVWEMARREGVDPDDLGDVRRNVIIRSLGPEASVQVDVEGPHPILPGDSYLLCSDGLTNHVKPQEIGLIVSLFNPEEACTLLIELANIRGGSDNVTCLIAHVPNDSDSQAKAAPPRRASPFRRAIQWWGKKISWSLTGLMLGGFLVALSIWMRLEQIPGAVPMFALAAIVMLVGLSGYAWHLKRKVEEGANLEDDDAKGLHIYKEYGFELARPTYEQFLAEEAATRQKAQDLQVEVNWEAHASAMEEARASATATDWRTAISAICRALQIVAGPINLVQHKAESFRPNWTSHHRDSNN
jgi:protein phosphatase